MLPVVLYNGNAPWGAARDVEDLVEVVPGGLERYRPRLTYCLLDEARIAASDPESLRNLAAALFQLERSRGPEDVQSVLSALVEWLREPERMGLRRAFATWLVQVLLPSRLSGAEIPKVADLQEVRSMLAERVRVKEWTQEWKQEGFQEGRQETLERTRRFLLGEMEKRFGPLSETTRRGVERIDSIDSLLVLTMRVGAASSLDDLGLTGSE